MADKKNNSERAKAIVEKLWASKSSIGLNDDERALLEELTINYLDSQKYYSIKCIGGIEKYQRLIDKKIIQESEFRSSCVLLTTSEQSELENSIESEGMAKGGEVSTGGDWSVDLQLPKYNETKYGRTYETEVFSYPKNYDDRTGTITTIAKVYGNSADNVNANARLIAGAPEMKESLFWTLNEIRFLRNAIYEIQHEGRTFEILKDEKYKAEVDAERILQKIEGKKIMAKGGHVIGYTNPKETISEDIYRAIQIIDSKDFIGEAYDLGSYKSNYMDLYFTIEIDRSKKEFEDGSEYSRVVYLKLDFNNFRNAEASELASKTLRTKIHFLRKNNRYLLNVIKFRPRKNEIDYRKDWLESSVGNMIKGVDFVYKKYPQLLETGSHPNMGMGGTAGMPVEAEVHQMNALIAKFMGEKHQIGTWYIPQHGELQSMRDDRAEHDSFERMEVFRDNELKYHSSWDWLMPVVKKIILSGHQWNVNYIASKNIWKSTIFKKTDWSKVSRDENDFFGGVKLSRENGELFDWKNECDIIAVWYSVVEFVKWHHNNKMSGGGSVESNSGINWLITGTTI